MRPTRGHLGMLLAACATAASLWAVAPALSLSPYVPQARQFSQPLPPLNRIAEEGATRSTHPGEGPVRYRSGVIDAPARFDLVGLGGELRPLEYRARTNGGTWSEWVETANGDPAYFEGGADQVQVRSRGIRPRGELGFVNVSGTATVRDRVLTATRGAVNSAALSTAAILGVSQAAAQTSVPQPTLMSRRKWDPNRQCRPRTSPTIGKVKAAAVHHTVTSNSYSRRQAKRIVLGICLFHRNDNGWNDIGYNFLVDRFGREIKGRAGGKRRAVVGAHAQGYNDQTTGVASLGTHTSARLGKRRMRGFVRLLAWKLDLHGRRARDKSILVSGGGSVNRFPRGKRVAVWNIFPHRRVNYTACPGDAAKSQLRRMRNRTQRRINRFS